MKTVRQYSESSDRLISKMSRSTEKITLIGRPYGHKERWGYYLGARDFWILETEADRLSIQVEMVAGKRRIEAERVGNHYVLYEALHSGGFMGDDNHWSKQIFEVVHSRKAAEERVRTYTHEALRGFAKQLNLKAKEGKIRVFFEVGKSWQIRKK